MVKNYIWLSGIIMKPDETELSEQETNKFNDAFLSLVEDKGFTFSGNVNQKFLTNSCEK